MNEGSKQGRLSSVFVIFIVNRLGVSCLTLIVVDMSSPQEAIPEAVPAEGGEKLSKKYVCSIVSLCGSP